MIEYKLDNRAIVYSREVLSHENMLSKHLHDKIDLLEGDIVTYFPYEISGRNLYKFETGGILVSQDGVQFEYSKAGKNYHLKPKASSCRCLADYVVDLLSRNPTYFCIFDDVMADPGDKDLLRFDNTYKIVGEEIYHIINNQKAGRELLIDIINAVQVSWHFLGIIGESKSGDHLFSKNVKQLEKEEFCMLLSNIKEIFFGAYDGEGFLHWRAR